MTCTTEAKRKPQTGCGCKQYQVLVASASSEKREALSHGELAMHIASVKVNKLDT